MSFEMLSSEDKIRIGAHLYIYWIPERPYPHYPALRWYREGEKIPIVSDKSSRSRLLGRTPCFDTATVEKLFKIDIFTDYKCEAGITDYIEITLIDGSRWFCTERAPCDGGFINIFLRAMHDEWVVRAQV